MILSRIFPLLLFCHLMIVACGPTAVPNQSSALSTDELNRQQQQRFERTLKPAFIHWGEIEDNQNRFQFDCQDCPTSMGQLISVTVDGSMNKPARLTGNCQGGLIAPDLFLTSRHCIPEDLQEKNKNCESRIKILFPKINAEQSLEIVRCQSIQNFSDHHQGLNEDDPQPDWALIKLKTELPHRLTPMQQMALPDATELKAFVPLQSLESDKVILTEVTCTSRQNSLALPEYQADTSPLLLLDCDRDITKGFSGTLFFKNSDQGLQSVATLSHIWDTQKNKENILVSQSVIASSFLCLPGDEDLPESCTFSPENHQSLKEKIVLEALEAERLKVIEAFKIYQADTHPIEWQELSDDALDKREATPQLLEFFEKIKNNSPNFMSLESHSLFLRSIAPYFPKCLKKEFVAELKEDQQQILTEMPVISVQITQGPQRRVRVRHKIRSLPVEVVRNANNLEQFTFSLRSVNPPHNRPERGLLSSRFNHAAASVPVCP